MDLEKEFLLHAKEDKENFDKLHDTLELTNRKLDKLVDSMDNLQGVSDFFRGTSLLRKPMMIFVGFIMALVALLGGFKALLAFFLPLKWRIYEATFKKKS